ncbi:MAG: SBBP repeat-containing protein [Bacteroidota bacterium]|nr:SBBP repeat-containing protein [Bacteroidota bacterium]
MKTIKTIYLTFLFSINIILCKAQNWQWISTYGGNSFDYGRGITIDSKDNLFITGSFQETANFGNFSLTSRGGEDMFIMKMNLNGKVEFVKNAGGKQQDYGKGICSDKNGNIYIIGCFQGHANFDDSVLVSKGKSDVFIAKYSETGVLKWVRKLGGAYDDEGNSICVDNYGNTYVTGNFSGLVIAGKESIKSNGKSDIFIAKYDPEGILLWFKHYGYPGRNKGNSITIDYLGNCYVTGCLDSTITYSYYNSGPNYNSNPKKEKVDQYIFVAKYNANGNLEWTKVSKGDEDNRGLGICVDSIGNCYVTGFFSGICKFDAVELSANNGWDIFLAKYDSSGKLLWAKSNGGFRHDYGIGICVDKNGNSYISGSFMKAINLGKNNNKGFRGWNGYIVKYDSWGNLIGSETIDATKDNYVYGISIDQAGDCFITGSCNKITKFGNQKINCSKEDIFVAKYKFKKIEIPLKTEKKVILQKKEKNTGINN